MTRVLKAEFLRPLPGPIANRPKVQKKTDLKISVYAKQWLENIQKTDLYRVGKLGGTSLIDKHFHSVIAHVCSYPGKKILNQFKNLNFSKILKTDQGISKELAQALEARVNKSIVGIRASLKDTTVDPSLGKTNLADIQGHLTQIRQGAENFVDYVNPLNKKIEKHFNIQQIHAYEHLAKRFAYCDEPNLKIDIPLVLDDQTSTVSYKVERIPLWLGYSAFGLIPTGILASSAPHILLFPGTGSSPASKGAGISVVEDFNPLGVGYGIWKKGTPHIRDWLELNVKKEQRCISIGHSLGGAIATYAAINHEKVDCCYSYNRPGLSFLEVRKYNQLKNKPIIFNFNHPDDFVPLLGGPKEVGQNLVEFSETAQPLTPKWWHQRKYENHSAIFKHNSTLFVKQNISTPVPIWAQILLLTPIYFTGLALLFAKRIILGNSSSRYWTYILGPVDFVVDTLYAIGKHLFQKPAESKVVCPAPT